MKKYLTILLMTFLVLMFTSTHAAGQIQRGQIQRPKTETPKTTTEKPSVKKPKHNPTRKTNRGRAQFGSQGHRASTVLPGNNTYRHQQEEEDQEFEVVFRCNIDNATLYIDDYEELGGANNTVTFAPGEYQISIEADGYEPCDTLIEINRDGMEFDFTLVEKERPMPILFDDLDDDRHLASKPALTASKPQIDAQQSLEEEQQSPLPLTEDSEDNQEPIVEEQEPVVEDQELVVEEQEPILEEQLPTPSLEPIPDPQTVQELQQDEVQDSEFETITVKGVSFTMVRVEGGTYTRYKIPENIEQIVDGDVYTGVPKAHNVTVSDFYIGMFEVTTELWYVVMADSVVDDGGLFPYDNASWNQCQVFIDRLNKMTGKKFRLPTDAEWEFAARGGVKSRGYVFSGSNNIDDVAWYNGNSDIEYHDVGTKDPNELGIYDMSGSVPEWCADWFWYWPGVNETTPPLVNPVGEKYKDKRVYRGGGYGNEASDCCVFRYFNDSPESGRGMGLRLAM